MPSTPVLTESKSRGTMILQWSETKRGKSAIFKFEGAKLQVCEI